MNENIKFCIKQRNIRSSAVIVAKLWDNIAANPDNWQLYNEMLSDIMCGIVDDAVMRFGAQNFGCELITAGVAKDDAENLVGDDIKDDDGFSP